MPICNYCGKGSGRRYTTYLGINYYYYCSICIGDFKNNIFERREVEAESGDSVGAEK